MAINISKSLNNVATAAIDSSGAVDTYKGALIYQSGPLKKYLTRVNASYIGQALATVQKRIHGRLVVCTGNLNFDELSGVFEGPIPSAWQGIPVTGAGQVIIDMDFIDSLELDFSSDPIIIDEADTVNICIGVAWVEGDVIPGLTKVTGRVNALGYIGEKKNQETFPFPLR